MKYSEWLAGLIDEIDRSIEYDRPINLDEEDYKMAKRVYMKLKEIEEEECPDA